MEIKSFTVADLKAALSSESFWLTKILPITKHRALSYIHNPRADENDPVLMVAYQDTRVIGYLGILPDKIFVNDAVYKLGWLSSWWVDPACKTTGVGAILLFRALSAYHQHLGVSGGSKAARKVLKATQSFMALKSLHGLEIKFRFNAAKNIPRKHPAMKAFRVLLKIFDISMDEIVNLRVFLWKRRNSLFRRLTFEYISSIDAETNHFIQHHHQGDLTRKGKADLNWVMTYPWLLSAPLKDSAKKKYFFSSLAEKFNYLGVKVLERSSGMIGFFMLKVRDDRVSVVYSFFDSRHTVPVSAALVYQTLALNVSTLNLYDERLVAGFSKLGCPCWSAKAVSRGFFLSKVFADIPLKNYRLHGGDGDLVFY